jgi:hypothetical protein
MHKKFITIVVISLGIGTGVSLGASATGAGAEGRHLAGAPLKPKYGGSARCVIECKDNVCKSIDASCAFMFETRTDAERALRMAIEARARAEGGRITGGISFSIEAKF